MCRAVVLPYVSDFGDIFLSLSHAVKWQCDGHALLSFTCLVHQKKLYSVDQISGQRTGGTNQFAPYKRSVRDAITI